MTFISVMEEVGRGFAKGLGWAVRYAVPVEKLAALLFPAEAPVVSEVLDAASLIQNAVLLVEQKYAASGTATGTGAQKLAEVMTLACSTVSGLLSKAGVKASADYVQKLVNAVVAILNAQPAPADLIPAK